MEDGAVSLLTLVEEGLYVYLHWWRRNCKFTYTGGGGAVRLLTLVEEEL